MIRAARIALARYGQLACVLGACLAVACGGGNSPSAPTANPAPTPAPSPSPAPTPNPALGPAPIPGTGPLPLLEGNWVGNIEAPGFSTLAVEVQLFQEGDEVEGVWLSTSSGRRWFGGIGGFAGPSSVLADMSFQYAVGEAQCTGVGSISGGANDQVAHLTWTITSYNTNTCSPMPGTLTMRLEKEQ